MVDQGISAESSKITVWSFREGWSRRQNENGVPRPGHHMPAVTLKGSLEVRHQILSTHIRATSGSGHLSTASTACSQNVHMITCIFNTKTMYGVEREVDYDMHTYGYDLNTISDATEEKGAKETGRKRKEVIRHAWKFGLQKQFINGEEQNLTWLLFPLFPLSRPVI